MTARLALTVAEFAEALGISVRSAYEMVQRGQVRVLRIGQGARPRIRIPESAVAELLAGAAPLVPNDTKAS